MLPDWTNGALRTHNGDVRTWWLGLAVLSLSGCWPFFVEPPPMSPGDGGDVLFEDDGGQPDAGGPALDKVNCTWKGKRLYGKIQFVDSFPDVKIREVTSLPDLRVRMVTSLPSRCGEWEEVTSLPTLRVKRVTALEDLQVEYVTSFPGFR
jgi:hypothetical protein